MLRVMCYVNRKGFTLVEIIVSLGVFLLFAVGIYSGIQFVFKAVYASRLRILETGILNEQIEIIRNMPFADVGIVNGSPEGLLTREEVITRNNIQFIVTRTIRNIDDPFDGTIGGTPNDTSPADYKLAEIEIICLQCSQQNPIRLSTHVGPKYLEGNTTNGALFIKVYNAVAAAVQGATVHVMATTTSGTIDIVDTTDNSGQVDLLDLPPGIGVYDIIVSKSGFITDRTVSSSQAIPNPVKPFASVVAQDVTSISFWIDRVSDITANTKNAACQAIGSVPVTILGTKLIGINPDTAIVSTTANTSAQGIKQFTDLVWDAYGLRPSNYDLLGSIPPLPLTIGPNVSQNVDLILGVNTPYSLLVNVLDSVTKQPVSNAMVTVTTTGFAASKSTGLGAITQTDWSGGPGQDSMIDPTEYWSDNGRIAENQPSGDVKLRSVGNHYMTSGELESSTFDLGAAANLIDITFQPVAQPTETGATPIRFQIATTSTAGASSWVYLGPDGTAQTFYDQTTPAISSVHNGQRYLRYTVYLSTEDNDFTPTLSDVSISYTVSCSPPGQAYFGGLSNGDYSVEVTKIGYQTVNQTITIDGDVSFAVDLVAS